MRSRTIRVTVPGSFDEAQLAGREQRDFPQTVDLSEVPPGRRGRRAAGRCA